jgi:hypothetical protein
LYCKGRCGAFAEKVKRKGGEKSPYFLGQKRCTTCEIYVTTEEKRCPCCNLLLKMGPTDRRLRDKLRMKKAGLDLASAAMI